MSFNQSITCPEFDNTSVTSEEIQAGLGNPSILAAAKAAHKAWCEEQMRQMGRCQNSWDLVTKSPGALRLNIAATIAVIKKMR